MRYLLFLCLLVLTLPVLGYNEVVSAISYNPSRLGAYTHLKAVEKAKLAGGLLQDGGNLNVLAKGTVTVQCKGSCNSNEINNIKPVGALESCEDYSFLCDQWRTSEKGGNLLGPDNNAGVPTGVSVSMYGGSLGNKTTTTVAVINAIALNNGATLDVNADTLTVQNLTIPNVQNNQLTLGGVSISAPTSVSGGSYKFVTRITDDKKKRNVLCIIPSYN